SSALNIPIYSSIVPQELLLATQHFPNVLPSGPLMPSRVRPLLGLLVASSVSAQTPTPTTPTPLPPVRFTGYVQVRETYRDEVGFAASINRARLSAFGTVVKDVTWRIQGEFRTGSVGTGKASVALQDGHIRYKPGQLGIQAGQFKTPFTREFLTSLTDVETADRATVVDSLAPQPDLGVMVDYAIGSVSTLMLGAFNGEGQNVTANTDSTLLWVGRATVRPIAVALLGANFASSGSDSTRYGVDAAVEYMGRPIEGVHRTAPGRRRRG